MGESTAAMTRMARISAAFLSALAVTTVLASAAQTQMVLAGLQALGAPMPLDVRLSATLHDIAGLGPAYGAVLCLALGLALPVGALGKRLLPALAPIAYPLAGAAGVAAALLLMPVAVGMMPISGARAPLGFALQCLAGAVGGWVFATVFRRL